MASAQTPLFTPLTLNQANLSSAALARYNMLSAPGANASVHLVSTLDIRTQNMGDTLYFSLPGSTEVLMAEPNLIEEHPNQDFIWAAQLLNKAGTMSLSHAYGQMFGYVQSDTSYWELLPIDSNVQAMVERHPSTGYGDSEPLTQTPTTPIPPSGPENCSFPVGLDPFNTCEAIIYVLVVVTSEAKDYILNASGYASVDAFINQGRNIVNQAFANSQIPNKQVVIKWIERDYETCLFGVDILEDADELPSCITQDIEIFKCDIGIMLTNAGYIDGRTMQSISGLTRILGPTGKFSIVEAPAFISAAYALPHEIGHLLGARHNWSGNFFGDDDTGTCAHAYCWVQHPANATSGVTYEVPLYTTILASNRYGYDAFSYEVEGPNGTTYYATLTSLVRLLHYSNPDVSSNSYPTGKPWADNSKLMRNTACQVADNFQNKHFSLGVRQTSCSSLPMLLTAKIGVPDPGVPGAGPYLVEWFFNSTLIGTGTTLNIQQHYDCPFYFIECRVTSSDGLVIKKWHKIDLRAIYCLCRSVLPGGGGGGNGGGERSSTDLEVASIYPNPVTEGSLVLMIPKLAKTMVNVFVHNSLGQIVANSNLPFDPFGYAYLDVSNVPDGCYVLRVNEISEENLNFKFIITHKQ